MEVSLEEKDIRLMKSFSYYAMGNITDGIKILEEGLKIYPDSKRMFNNLSIFLSDLGKFDQAKEAIEKAIKIDPLEANFYDTYGEILMYAKKYESAIEKFTQALTINPTGWFAFHTFLKLTKCYKSLGMHDKANICYDKAKILTEKVLPGKRKLYLDKLDENIKELGKVSI
jgi:tetratricopeptide (TPR) repeat protein